jgi:hypothetical protein
MINSSRLVTDPKLTFLELLMVRFPLGIARNFKLPARKPRMKANRLPAAFQRLEHDQTHRRGLAFAL